MTASRDIFLRLDDLPAETIDSVITRLELRAREPRFVQMRTAYLDAAGLAGAKSFLDLGCGTGVDARAVARRPEYQGLATGLDLSAALVEAGLRLAAEEGLSGRVDLRVGDAQATALPDASFDVVVMHTLLSHVQDPLAVLREAARLLAPAGRLIVFDADFASLSFAHPDITLARAMEEALLAAMVAQPRVMRDLPRLGRLCGLQVTAVQEHVVADIGASGYFLNFAETYAPVVASLGFLPEVEVAGWLAAQRRAAAAGEFFASCNFYAYFLQRA